MRILVLNKAAEVGKSTVARYMLADPMGAMLISIVGAYESDGRADSRCLRKTSSGLPGVLTNLAHIPNAVVDINSEDHAAVMVQLEAMPNYHELFDFIVVPVTGREASTGRKSAQDDTIETILTLADHRVLPEKVRVLFNMDGLGRNGDVYDHFDTLLEFYSQGYNMDRPKFAFRPEAILRECEALRTIHHHGHAIPDQLANMARADFRKQLAEAKADADETCIEVMENMIKHESNLKQIKREIDVARAALFEPATIES